VERSKLCPSRNLLSKLRAVHFGRRLADRGQR
jgi:hypothetical protein